MNCNLLLFAVFFTIALSPAAALWRQDGKNISYVFETRVHSNLPEEHVKVAFDIEIKGPNLSYKTDIHSKPSGWYNGWRFYYLMRVAPEIDLYDATEYSIAYTTHEGDENTDRVVSVSEVAIVEPDVKEPKNVRLCSPGHKNQDKTDLLPGSSVTLIKCD